MSKFQRLTWLSVGIAGALLLSACVAEEEEGGAPAGDVAADVAQDPASGDIAVKLSVDTTKVSSKDRVIVNITLTNNAKHSVKLLGWYAPGDELEEDLFEVTLAGQAVDFIGPHYKRPAPELDDFINIAAGKSVTRSVDITDFYNLSQSGDYSVRYSTSISRADTKDIVPIASNDVSLWIEGRGTSISPPVYIKYPGPTGVTSSVSFSKCDATQSSTVLSALNAASGMANGALTYLTNTAPSGTPRYTTWFGAFSSGGWNTAKSHYTAIKGVFGGASIKFDCGCKKKYYAYVYPNQPYNIYLCSVFWGAPLTGTDSKGGTIVHETSHFDLTAGTDDWVYGQSGAKSLAISDPTKALDNADSHEYFAENTPALQ